MVAFITFVLFTVAVAVIAWLATRHEKLDSSAGYFLAGRSLTGPIIAGSLMLTNLSTEHLVGMNGSSYREGILVMAWETLAALAAIALALFFLPRYLKSGIATIPQFLEDRFDGVTRKITSVLFLSFYVVAQLPIVLFTGAIGLEGLFQVSEVLGMDRETSTWIMVWSIGSLGACYAIFGGLKAVAVSDTINGIGLITGGLLVPIFGLVYIGQGDFFAGIDMLWEENPEKFDIIGDSESSVPFVTLFTGMIYAQVFYWCTNQAIIQRSLGAKNLAEAQKGALYAGFLKLLGPIIVVLPGVIAFHVFQGNLENPDEAYPRLVSLVLPAWMTGFFAAVMVGAILSTFNSALNSCATLFSTDVYKGWLKPAATELQMVHFGKIVGVVLALAAMIVAPLVANAPDGLYILLQTLNGIFNVPIFTVVFVGLITKRVPPLAAKLVLILGPIAYLLLTFVIKLDLHFLHIMGMLGVFNLALMLIVGWLAPSKEPYVQEYSGDVDITPWKYRIPVSLFIAICTISCYVFFARG